MKKIFMIMMVLLLSTSAYGGLITNGAATDSLSFPFVIWDSTGNSTLALASGDSVWLFVRYPNGQLAFKDSTDFNDSEIVGETSSSFTTYAWRDNVQQIDGTPVYGASYAWEIMVKDLTSAATETRAVGEFTILPNFIDMYDGTGYAGGTAFFRVNTIQISNSEPAANNIQTFFDNTGSQWINFDNMYDGTGYAGGSTKLGVNIVSVDADAIEVGDLDAPVYLAIADTNWDEVLTGGTHNVQNSAGKRLRAVASDVISNGTGRGAPDGNTFLLATAESASDDFYNGHVLKIISGTGISQERLVEDYTGATDSITLHAGAQDAWTTNPANGDLYEIIGGHAVEMVHIHDGAIDDIAAYAEYVVKGDVDAGTFSVNSFTSADLTQGDNFWLLNQVHFFTGSLAGQTSIISSFVAASDLVINYPSFTAAPVEGDSFKILANILPYISSRQGYVLSNLTGTAVDNIAAYPDYTYKMVARGSPTTTTFEVSYINPTPTNTNDDFCLGMLVQAQNGGSNAKAVIIAGYTGADSAFTVRPGFASSMNAGDTVFIRPVRGAIEPTNWLFPALTINTQNTIPVSDTNIVGDTLAVKKDSLIYQGAGGGGLDTLSTAFQTALIDLFWSEDSTGYSGIEMAFLASQTGASGGISDADFSLIADTLANRGMSTGGGTEPETLVVLSTSDSTAIESASIVIRTLDQTTVKVDGWLTNVSGKANLELDIASYFRSVTHNNYTQVNDTLAVASGGGTDTTWMTPFDPGTATAGGTGVLYGRIHDVRGTVLQGAIVTVTIPDKFKNLTHDGVVVTPFNRADTTDSSGDWSISLYQYNELSDTTAYYIVTANEPSSGQIIGGEIFSVGYLMPDSVQHKLAFGSDFDQNLD